MSELADVKLGDVGDLKLVFEDGMLKLSIVAGKQILNGVSVGLAANANVAPAVFIKMLEDAIPGEIDNVILDGLAAAFLPKA